MSEQKPQMSTTTKLAIVLLVVIVIFAGAYVVLSQNQPKFTADREEKQLYAEILETNIVYYEVKFHLKYHGNSPLTNVYIFFDQKDMFIPIVDTGWSLTYTTYIYRETVGKSTVRIVWTGGEENIIVE